MTSQSHHILVVHDDPGMLRLITSELESRGFACTAAEDPPTAFRLLGQDDCPIETAVIDRVLGGPIDGVDLMAALRQKRPSLDAIILTAYGGVDIGLDALRRGAYRYFMAPYNFDEIAIAIRYLHERKTAATTQAQALGATPKQLAWLQSCVDCLPDEVVLLNKSYEILLANKAKKKAFGPDLFGRLCYKIFEDRDKPCENCPTIKAFEGHAVGPIWHEYLGRDGKHHVAEITAGPILGAKDEIVAVVEVVRDATKRKHLDDSTVQLELASSLKSIQSIITTGLVDLGAERVRLYLHCEREKKLIGVTAIDQPGSPLVGMFESGAVALDVSPVGPRAPRLTVDKKQAILYRLRPEAKDWVIWEEGPKWVCEAPEIPYASALDKDALAEWLDLPLVAGNETVGMISLDRKQSKSVITDGDYQLFGTLATVAAQAIENAMRRQEADALQKIETNVSPESSLEDVLTKIVGAVPLVFHEGSAHVRVTNETGTGLEMRAGVGDYWTFASRNRTLGQGVSGWVAENKRPMIIDDVKVESDLKERRATIPPDEAASVPSSLQAFLDRQGSIACLPIIYNKEVLGTLSVSCPRLHAFARRMPFLEDLAKLAASAIFTSRLLVRLKSKVYQLNRLLEEAQAAQKGPDLGRTMFTVLTALTYKGGLEFNRALLFVLEGETLVCRLALGPLDHEEAKKIHQDPMWAPGRTPPGLKVLGDLYEKNPLQYLTAPIVSLAKKLVVRVDDSTQALCQVLETKKTLVGQASGLVPGDRLRALAGGEFAITPLVVDDKAIGAIYVDNKFTRKSITQESIDLLELFASHAAVAIHNAGERDRLSRTYRDAYDRVAADTAHSLGNALNPIATRLEIMRLILAAGEAIQLQELERLEAVYGQATSIVTQVMKCTTPIEIHPDDLELGRLIRALIGDRAPIARPRLDCGDREWQVSGDTRLLSELFRELFQNADSVGATLQDVSLRESSWKRDHAGVEVVVRDQGPGVPQRLKEEIFEPLVSRRPGGTGLGLYRVRGICESHGGMAWECGVEGVGAEFHVVLPLKLP